MIKIFLYNVSSTNKQQLCKKLSVLSEYEKKRADKFKFEKDFKLYVAGKIMTRKIIAEHIGIKPDKVKFYIDKYDRPFLEYPAPFKKYNKANPGKISEGITAGLMGYNKRRGIDFNISHSGDYVVLAIGSGRVGVDIERIKPIDLGIANDCFHDKELEYLQSDQKKMLENFYKIWTLKESFIKAVGQGLSYSLKDFYFSTLDDEHPEVNIINSKDNNEWNFKMYQIDIGYKLAVCARGKESSSNSYPEKFRL